MALSRIWVSMICVALAFGAASGRGAQLGAAAAQGVQQAVDFCLTVGGMICLWSGVMELMRRCGIAGGLSRLLRPVLRRLFPHAARDAQALDALSMNVSANLLGLGNAATPAGVRAAQAMARELRGDAASDELCLLVVLNTASIQLLPVTIAAVREAAGAARAHMAVSDLLTLTVPLLLAGVGLCGVLTGTDVFSALTDGARDGLKTVMRIFPALVALLTAVSMLRASGALEALTRLCAPVLAWLRIPPETAMLLLLRRRFPHRAHRRRHARFHRDDVLRAGGLFRRMRHPAQPLGDPRRHRRRRDRLCHGRGAGALSLGYIGGRQSAQKQTARLIFS